MQPKILITGASGIVGGFITKKLLEKGESIRVMVDDETESYSGPPSHDIEVVKGSFLDFDSVSNALKGVDSAFFSYPMEIKGLLEATAYFAQAAIEESVSLVVNLSHHTSRRMAKSYAARNFWFAERVFDRSGIPVTHLRPTLLAERLTFFASSIKESDSLPSPFGNTKYAPVCSEDVGSVAATILREPAGHAGQTYSLFGPAEVSQQDIAEILSSELHRNISYIPTEVSSFTELLQGLQYSPYFVQHMSATAIDVRNGLLSGTGDWIEKITHDKPLSLQNYIQKNILLFK